MRLWSLASLENHHPAVREILIAIDFHLIPYYGEPTPLEAPIFIEVKPKMVLVLFLLTLLSM